ncbi:MAG TPA: HepT-like ribonuclease domain-containing protein [Candidatus Deferrimicrobium sp.]|nr:HepT-like ribonuclease domain-containing protein [Candidatus Deferrimicrobium sp.]
MYDENNLVYILTILENIEKIKIYSSEYGNADDFLWANQQLNFNGTVNLLIAIGEESKKIDAKLKEEFLDIDWKAIAGIRDKMSHDYRGIDPHIVWNVIQTKLDDLKQTMIQMVERIDYDKEMLLEALKTNYYNHLSYLMA